MDTDLEKKLAEYDARRRRIEKFVAVLLTVLLVALLWVEASLFDFRGSFPAPFNLVFFSLLNVNIILIFILLFLVFRNIAKLVFERRAKILGSKLRTKLIAAFAAFALVPTIAFFYVAVTFITKSIDTWFSEQVESSLKESMDVAHSYYKAFEESAVFFADRIAEGLEDRVAKDEFKLTFPNAVLQDYIDERQAEYNLDAVDVYVKKSDEPRYVAGEKLLKDELPKDAKQFLTDGWKGKKASKTFETGKGETVWGLAPIELDENVLGVLVVRYQIPESLLGRMKGITDAYQDYKKFMFIEDPLKTSYYIILALISLFIFFGASWFGFLLSRNMVGPINKLVEGTRKVAEGDMKVRLKAATSDEFGNLVDNFNLMTQRLEEGRRALEVAASELRESNIELEQRRAYMETVLGNITAGVISFDLEARISTINNSAMDILNISHPDPFGKTAREVFGEDLDSDVAKRILNSLDRNPNRTVLEQVEMNVGSRTRTLLVSVSRIRDDQGQPTGTVIVLEDLTNLVKAQRMAAWQEVAKRIAHEIKNPLTPIQLSAQRLRKRYGSRFEGEDKVFYESTATIIKQVDDLKRMVDEFSNFARMAEPVPAQNDVNEILPEAIILYSEAHKNIRFDFKQSKKLPRIFCDRDQMKRVFINILDNAVASIQGKGKIKIITAFDKDDSKVQVKIEDNGSGLPDGYRDRLFEPYFSTKKMGTGLGLAIVNQILSDIGGEIRLEDNQPKGTRVIIRIPVIRAKDAADGPEN